jgi:hypothetical protein
MIGPEATEDMLDYIRRAYGVPARIGVRIRYTGSQSGRPMDGTIVGARGQYLLAEMDLPDHIRPVSPNHFILHPTWEVEYLNGQDWEG